MSADNKSLVYLGFALLMVGYMTLTISLPLVHNIATHSHASELTLGHCISLVFLGFSLSAIILSRLADMSSPFTILKYAQITSIIGLITLSVASHAPTFFIGFALIGGSTGCYSSIARMIIVNASPTELQIRKNFTVYSTLTIVAPLLSAQLALLGQAYYWQLSYLLMAAIEIILYFFVVKLLRGQTKNTSKHSGVVFLSGYLYCLKKPYYTVHMICTGLGVAAYIRVIIGNTHPLFIRELHQSDTLYSTFTLAITVCYLLGIFILRHLPKTVPAKSIRMTCSLMFFVTSVIVFTLAHAMSTLEFTLGLCVYSLFLGILNPLTSSQGFTAIEHHRGAASALYTFSFAFFSMIYSTAEALTGARISQSINISLLVFSSALMGIAVLLFYRKIGYSRQHH